MEKLITVNPETDMSEHDCHLSPMDGCAICEEMYEKCENEANEEKLRDSDLSDETKHVVTPTATQ